MKKEPHIGFSLLEHLLKSYNLQPTRIIRRKLCDCISCSLESENIKYEDSAKIGLIQSYLDNYRSIVENEWITSDAILMLLGNALKSRDVEVYLRLTSVFELAANDPLPCLDNILIRITYLLKDFIDENISLFEPTATPSVLSETAYRLIKGFCAFLNRRHSRKDCVSKQILRNCFSLLNQNELLSIILDDMIISAKETMDTISC